MVDSVTLEISGLKELADKMRSLGPELNKKALRAGVSAAARIVRDDARARNPDDTGKTEKAIISKYVKKESNNFKQTYIVTVHRRAWYWRFVEFGTANLAARPFLRPAFEASKSKLVAAIASRIAKQIKAYDKKQARLIR